MQTTTEHWLEQQIEFLRTKNWEKLDIEGVIEELNKSNEHALYSYLVVILCHLTKWRYQPTFRCGSWKGSINNGRRGIQRLFRRQPGLKKLLAHDLLQEAWTDAREWASDETGIELRVFPDECPFEIDECVDINYLPI